VPRSAEIKPLFWRFVYSSLFNFTVRGGTRTGTLAFFLKALKKTLKKKNFFLSPEIIALTIISDLRKKKFFFLLTLCVSFFGFW